ncbi:unnamed protein product [Owenia fusiformis]|uniref:EF-hand domain-containing protein n=1 Tax=Owenia fusiformis TaxID=6347 RepID=A0A8S4Q7Y4_OWEFU|nr:unnamed protein product [Owenia fusiformis]
MAGKLIVLCMMVVILASICIDDSTACFVSRVTHIHTCNNCKVHKRSVRKNSEYTSTFKACDSDDNGKLIEKEMMKCFPQPGSHLAEIFESLDIDRDGELTFEEFQKAELNPKKKPATNCHLDMLEKCGGSFLQFAHAHARDQSISETSMCEALQEYGNCVDEKSGTCHTEDTKNFAAKLLHMIRTSKKDGVCPDIKINGLDNKDDGNFEKLPCSKDAILKCDKQFLDDILQWTPSCDALEAYDECLQKTTESCNDEASESARKAADDIFKAYKSTGECDGNTY